MNIKEIDIFLAAVSEGSLAGASRRLDISAMAVSRAIAALEQSLGVRLLHRTTRSISLTQDGEELLPFARSMIELNDAARNALAPSGRGIAGKLRVTCPHVFGRVVLTPLVRSLLNENPKLSIELILTDEIVDLVEAGIDVAIRLAHPKDSNLVARKLSPNPRVLCATPDYIERHGQPRLLADLASHECLALVKARRWPFIVSGELKMTQVQGRFSCTSAEGIRAACMMGQGLTLLTQWDVAQELSSGTLVSLVLEDAAPQALPIWAMMPTSRYVPIRVRAFLDALTAHLNAAGTDLNNS
ncbi:TPA: LysR family transcriptional regulator [Pseudomonas aeruginosa]|nr:LysR family transcriptional regulator [Pseudomonas aeruginosa]